MQVTKELVENDIKAMEASVENLKAQLAQTLGALTTLKNIKEYLDKPEPDVEPEPLEKSPVKVADNSGIVTVDQEGDNLVVDGYGKYNSKAEMEIA